jgi:hypothetical protein
MGSHPPYLFATSVKDIVSEADLRMIAIFVAMSLRAITSLTDGRADILPLEESDVVRVSAALATATRPPIEESDRDKLSDALLV